jgi:hypothetical protein
LPDVPVSAMFGPGPSDIEDEIDDVGAVVDVMHRDRDFIVAGKGRRGWRSDGRVGYAVRKGRIELVD